MESLPTPQPAPEDSSAQRLDRLSRRKYVRHNAGYSKFVRLMRLILPMAALGIVATLFLWNAMEKENFAPPPAPEPKEQITQQKIARNELLNPEFESLDKKNQPYKITADKAIQGEKNKNLIMLENPIGTLTMQDGVQVRVTSQTGAYRQDTQRFFLEGNVWLTHDADYSLQSEQAHIDLKDNYAWSDEKVSGKGPDMEIDAKGLRANGKTGKIVFTGPVKLVLEGDQLKGLE
ncbi:MAG: LPS export ABC transporter periplasmic protein LptC [Alphaproteobacteria bacterium]|nr:LPS export ABC transporter periplasmic protein LptC [Alphaproteobacteria bacterium]